MTNLKAKGFDSPAQLREHLDDIVESDHVSEEIQFDDHEDAQIREVAWLRKEVSDLRLQLQAIAGGAEGAGPATIEAGVPWLKIVGAITLTYILARVAQA